MRPRRRRRRKQRNKSRKNLRVRNQQKNNHLIQKLKILRLRRSKKTRQLMLL